MSIESTMPLSQPVPLRTNGGFGIWLRLLSIAWRNLWRNRRRTWLTVSGIAFSVWLLVFARSIQDGTFELMVDNGARMLPGHVQVQHPEYSESPRMEYTFRSPAVIDLLRGTGDFEFVSARAQGFALVSVVEKSFGAQVIGLEPAIESQWSTLAGMVNQGRYLERPGETVIGQVLARNIGAKVGDELILIGTAKQGGVAALAVNIVGVYDSGQPDLDRGIVQIHIDDFRPAWDMAADESHLVVAVGKSLSRSDTGLSQFNSHAQAAQYGTLGWRELMPEAEQMWDMKQISTEMFFYIIAVIVGFSVVTTFMMLVFERTSEMGMLMAIGMKPKYLIMQLQLEATLLSVTGIAIGGLLAGGLLAWIGESGMPLPVDMDELYKQYNMPDRLYPNFDYRALYIASVIMFIGTQLAAFIPGQRIFRMRPVEAIRQEG
jgi:putative ABC transport system permease protein